VRQLEALQRRGEPGEELLALAGVRLVPATPVHDHGERAQLRGGDGGHELVKACAIATAATLRVLLAVGALLGDEFGDAGGRVMSDDRGIDSTDV